MLAAAPVAWCGDRAVTFWCCARDVRFFTFFFSPAHNPDACQVSELGRVDALTLVDVLVARLKLLDARIRDMQDDNSSATIQKLLQEIEDRERKYLSLQDMYEGNRRTVAQFLALSERDEKIRLQNLAAMERLKKELHAAKSHARELELRLEDVPDYPELQAQFTAMQNRYKSAKLRLDKMLEWTKVQVRASCIVVSASAPAYTTLRVFAVGA